MSFRKNTGSSLIAICSLVSLSFIATTPAQAGMTRCETSVYGFCLRNWQAQGYASMAECYDTMVEQSCREQ